MVNFIVELTSPTKVTPKDIVVSQKTPLTLKLHMNMFSSIDFLGEGLILTLLDKGEPLKYTLVLTLKGTNNEVR